MRTALKRYLFWFNSHPVRMTASFFNIYNFSNLHFYFWPLLILGNQHLSQDSKRTFERIIIFKCLDGGTLTEWEHTEYGAQLVNGGINVGIVMENVCHPLQAEGHMAGQARGEIVAWHRYHVPLSKPTGCQMCVERLYGPNVLGHRYNLSTIDKIRRQRLLINANG